jgi:hypothetical protein
VSDDNQINPEWRSDYEAAAQHTLEASLAATPSQRLAWLEEALAFAYRVGALKVRTTENETGEPDR